MSQENTADSEFWDDFIEMMSEAVRRRPNLQSRVESAHEAVKEAQRQLRAAEDALSANSQAGQHDFLTKVRDHAVTIVKGRSILVASDAIICGTMKFTDCKVDLSESSGVVMTGGDLSMQGNHAGYGLSIKITASPDPTLVGKIYGVRAADCTFLIGEDI